MPVPGDRVGPHFMHHPDLVVPAPAPPALTDRERQWSLIAIIASAFGVGWLFSIGAPLKALNLEAWQQPTWLIGLAGASPSLAVLLVLPFAPAWAARLGAVRANVIACAITIIGFGAMYLFQSPWAWIGIHFVMCASLAVPWLIGETWVNAVAQNETRGRVIAIFSISFFLGFAAGPYCLSYTGISGPWPFMAGVMGAVLAVLPILAAARYAPDLTHDERTMKIWPAMLLAPLGVIGGFLSGVVEMSNFALLANVGLAAGLESDFALQLLAVLSLGGCFLQFGIGWLADKVARVKVLLGMCVSFVGIMVLLPWALTHHMAAIATAFALGGIVLGFYTVGLAIIGDDVQPKDLASANAAFLVMYQIGGMLGPAVSGAAMSVAPVSGFVVALCSIVLAGALLVVMMERSRKAEPAPVQPFY